jgi:hypothetical protein
MEWCNCEAHPAKESKDNQFAQSATEKTLAVTIPARYTSHDRYSERFVQQTSNTRLRLTNNYDCDSCSGLRILIRVNPRTHTDICVPNGDAMLRRLNECVGAIEEAIIVL